MIKEIRFRNWKSFEESTLFIDPLTILIGTNASGKSNALDACIFLQRISSGVALTSALQGDIGLPEMRGGVEWVCRRGADSFTLETVVSLAEERMELIYSIEVEVLRRQSRCQVKSERLIRRKFRPKTTKNPYTIKLFWTEACDEQSPSITARLYNGKNGAPRPCARHLSVLAQLFFQARAGLRKEISQGVRDICSAFRAIFMLEPVPSRMRDDSALSEDLLPDASNIAGVIAEMSADPGQDIQRTLTHYLKSLSEKDIVAVFTECVGRFGDAMLYCEEQWGEDAESILVDAQGMSDGTLRFLAILVALLTRPRGSLLIIEEIDNGLHPSRAHLLVHTLKTIGQERGVDILLTTHNPALLDSLGGAMIPFVTVTHRHPHTGFSQLTLLEDIQALPKLLARGTLGTLSSEGSIEAALHKHQGE